MESIRICGGAPLGGTLRVHGAKNAALPILIAAAGIGGRFTLRRCPRIRDVEVVREILSDLGVETRREGDALLVDSRRRHSAPVRPELAASLRASSLFLGALAGAWGRAEVPLPGGCPLSPGLRPLDLHLSAFSDLGLAHDCADSVIRLRGQVRGGTVILRYPSVGATENVILAALGADGPVQLLGAAREPEIVDLAAFLGACGAEISGAGSSRIEIRPAPLHGADYTILPDRIEAVTWLCAAACTGGALTLEELPPALLGPVPGILRRAGCRVEEEPDTIRLEAGPLRAVEPLVTGPWPGFPTDAQPPVMAALCLADGVTLMEETVFACRFRHVPGLVAMGADVELAGRAAAVRGVASLRGARAAVPDLRGGAALLCAALAAEGESLLTNAALLERGYQDLVPTLDALGARVSPAE